MTPEQRRRAISWGALALGVLLFAITLYYVDIGLVVATGRRLGIALPLALIASGLWHLVRTWAWAWCFPQPRRVGFWRLARVRLAAEAFSYLTLRGIAGEPLKVVLLAEEIDPREATAAVALERIAYLVGTTLIVGLGSIVAIVALPLSHVWFRIFRAFAIGSLVMGVLTALVVTGRGTYLVATLRRIDRGFDSSLANRRIARFMGDVERQLLDLVRGSTTRLAVLAVATAAAYACMAAEAWLILRAVGVPISLIGALTIETFSRVASFASAFIPANLGALEASSVAAVAAVGAAGAGAPLALARRLRGLFWAGLGLAIYPRRPRTVTPGQAIPGTDSSNGPVLLYLPADPAVSVSPFTRIAGLPIAERMLRSAERADYCTVLLFADAAISTSLRRIAREIHIDVRFIETADAWSRAVDSLPPDSTFTVVGAGTVVSPALLEDAAAMPLHADADIADVSAGASWPVSGLLRVQHRIAGDVHHLAAALHARLTSAAPMPSGDEVAAGAARLAVRIRRSEDLLIAEEALRRSSYKPTDNTLARFNRRISLPISVALIPTPLTANQLSVALVAMGFYSAWLFSLGHYAAGVLGAFLSLAASVLDGCDGEIARLKYQESALGCWIETVGDYSYYIAIFVGLSVGAVRGTGSPIFLWLGIIALAGMIVTFALLIFLRSRITAGRPERLHEIGRDRFMSEPSWWSYFIWRISFVATRSAMPYGIMALAILGLLPLVVVLAAIGSNTYWISLVLKMRHLLGEEELQIVEG